MTTDTALYIGEAGKFLPDGTPLIPNVTVAFIPAAEALLSDLWDPISPVANPATSKPIDQFDGGIIPPAKPQDSPPLGGTLDGGTP